MRNLIGFAGRRSENGLSIGVKSRNDVVLMKRSGFVPRLEFYEEKS